MSYFWILTLQWSPSPAFTQTRTASGQYTAVAGMTRGAAFNEILAMVKRSIGPGADSGVALFFSLEPDALVPAPTGSEVPA